MISICLTQFTNSPWANIMMKAFKKALSENPLLFIVEDIFGYPKKKYDLIILVGIRSLVKQNLDKNKILPYCEKLIDMGDNSMDPRNNYEDIYFYFTPSNTKLYEHYYYLPKFVLEDYLYPSSEKREKLNVFVDHFNYQTNQEREISIKVIKKIFYDLNNAEIPINVFYHTSKGIELNRLHPEIPEIGVSNCALYIPFKKISEYYRKTDIFLPTHRESQGMLAQEIGACGGLTVLQDWMYPKATHHQFPCLFYTQNQKIDFVYLKNLLNQNPKKKLRKHVLKHCSFENFKLRLTQIIKQLFNE